MKNIQMPANMGLQEQEVLEKSAPAGVSLNKSRHFMPTCIQDYFRIFRNQG